MFEYRHKMMQIMRTAYAYFLKKTLLAQKKSAVHMGTKFIQVKIPQNSYILDGTQGYESIWFCKFHKTSSIMVKVLKNDFDTTHNPRYYGFIVWQTHTVN